MPENQLPAVGFRQFWPFWPSTAARTFPRYFCRWATAGDGRWLPSVRRSLRGMIEPPGGDKSPSHIGYCLSLQPMNLTSSVISLQICNFRHTMFDKYARSTAKVSLRDLTYMNCPDCQGILWVIGLGYSSFQVY